LKACKGDDFFSEFLVFYLKFNLNISTVKFTLRTKLLHANVNWCTVMLGVHLNDESGDKQMSLAGIKEVG
jgi:hypothetical protein